MCVLRGRGTFLLRFKSFVCAQVFSALFEPGKLSLKTSKIICFIHYFYVF